MTAQARSALASVPRCDTATCVWLAAAALLAASTLLAFTPSAPVRDRGHALAVRPRPSPPSPTAARPTAAPVGRPQAGRSRASRAADITVEHGTLRLRNDDPESGVGIRQLWQLEPGGPRTFRLVGDRGERRDRRACATAFASARSRWSPTRTSIGVTSIRCTGWPGCAARRAPRALCRVVPVSEPAPAGRARDPAAPRHRRAAGLEPAPGGAGRAALVRRGARRAADRLGRAAGRAASGCSGAASTIAAAPWPWRWRRSAGRAAADARGHARQHAAAAGRLAAAQLVGSIDALACARPLRDLRRRRVPRPAQPPRRPLAGPASAAASASPGCPRCCSSWPSCARRPLDDWAHQRAGGVLGWLPAAALAVVASGGAVCDADPLLDHGAAAAGEAAPVVGLAQISGPGRGSAGARRASR